MKNMTKQDLIRLSNSKIYLKRIERLIQGANRKQLEFLYKEEKKMFKNYGFKDLEMKNNSILDIFRARINSLLTIEINEEIRKEQLGCF